VCPRATGAEWCDGGGRITCRGGRARPPTASAANTPIQVITTGYASVLAGGATTLGTPVIRSATTAGYVTSSATPVTGTVVGFALGASASGRSDIWVLPGTNTSS
jgi:hypothetical protein